MLAIPFLVSDVISMTLFVSNSVPLTITDLTVILSVESAFVSTYPRFLRPVAPLAVLNSAVYSPSPFTNLTSTDSLSQLFVLVFVHVNDGAASSALAAFVVTFTPVTTIAADRSKERAFFIPFVNFISFPP